MKPHCASLYYMTTILGGIDEYQSAQPILTILGMRPWEELSGLHQRDEVQYREALGQMVF